MKKIGLMLAISVMLAACGSTGGTSSSQVYGQIGGGVGYTSH